MTTEGRALTARTAERSPLQRSDPSSTGIRRRRCGRGFSYLGPDAVVVKDPQTLARIKSLVIPPAWQDVWICVDPQGHIQAMGTDSAGRRQYRYHDLWREQRDQDKRNRVRQFGAALPGHTRDPRASSRCSRPGPGKSPGGRDTPGRPWLLPARRRRVRRAERHLRPGHHPPRITSPWPRASSCSNTSPRASQQREQAVAEQQVCAVVRGLLRRRGGGDQLLAYRSGARWHDVTAADINDYLREVSGGDYTAKDFRTWHATVLAAVGLAVSESRRAAETARKARHRPGCRGRSPATWATPPPWPAPPTSTPASSSITRLAAPLLPRWASWARTAISVTSPPGAGQKAPS